MPTIITRDEVKSLIAEGGQLVDALSRREFELEHIRGAVDIPIKALNRESAARLDKSRPVIAYCHDMD